MFFLVIEIKKKRRKEKKRKEKKRNFPKKKKKKNKHFPQKNKKSRMSDLLPETTPPDADRFINDTTFWYAIYTVLFLFVCYFIYLFTPILNTAGKKGIASVVMILFFLTTFYFMWDKTKTLVQTFSLDVNASFYVPLGLIFLMMMFTMGGSNIENNKTELGTNICLFLVFLFTLSYLFLNKIRLNSTSKEDDTTGKPASNTFNFFEQVSKLLGELFPALDTFNFFKKLASTLEAKSIEMESGSGMLFKLNKTLKTPTMMIGYLASFIYFLLSVFLPSKYSGSFKSTTHVLLFFFSMVLFLYALLWNQYPNGWIGNVMLMVLITIITCIYFFPLWFLKNSLYIFVFFVGLGVLTGICRYLLKLDFKEMSGNVIFSIYKFYEWIKTDGVKGLYNYITSFDRIPTLIFLLIIFLIFLFTGINSTTNTFTEKIFNCVWQLFVIIIFAYIVSFFSVSEEQDVVVTSAFWHAKYVIFYVVFLILFFNIIEKDVLNKYAFFWVPFLICLGASVFYTSLQKVSTTSKSTNNSKNLPSLSTVKKIIPTLKKTLQRQMTNPNPNQKPSVQKRRAQPPPPRHKGGNKGGQQGGSTETDRMVNAILMKRILKEEEERKKKEDPKKKEEDKDRKERRGTSFFESDEGSLNDMLMRTFLPGKSEELDKRTVTNYQLKLKYERLKSIIIFFCLVTCMLIFYVVDPAGYFSTYLGSNFIYTILIGIFGFIFMTILSSYPQIHVKKTQSSSSSSSSSAFTREEQRKYGFRTMKKKSDATMETKFSPQTVAPTENLFDAFDTTTVISSIMFFLFIIIITIVLTTYKDGFMKSNSFSGIIIIVIIFIVFLWGAVLGMMLFKSPDDKKKTTEDEETKPSTETGSETTAEKSKKLAEKETKERKAAKEKEKEKLYLKQWNVGLILSGGFCLIFFIVFIVKFFSDVSTTANIYQLIFNLIFMILYGILVMKNVLPEMKLPFVSNYRLGKTSAIIIGLILVSTILSRLTGSSFPLKLFFIMGITIGTAIYFGIQSIVTYIFLSCFSVWIAFLLGFLNELKYIPWYYQAGLYGILFVYIYTYLLRITNSAFYIHLIFLLVAGILLYTFLPTIKENITLGATGKQFITNPVPLNKRLYVTNYEELNGSSISTYNFAFSFWFYIESDTPNSFDYFSLFDYGGKPTVSFTLHDTALKITVKVKTDPEDNVIIYSTNSILLQKWNHMFINFDGGTIDIFLNGELVRSAGGIVPWVAQDALYVGEDNGIQGNMCNLIYFTQPQSITTILYLYNSMRYTTPPVPKAHNQLVDVKDLDEGEKIVRYS